jgi:hypothetical protein
MRKKEDAKKGWMKKTDTFLLRRSLKVQAFNRFKNSSILNSDFGKNVPLFFKNETSNPSSNFAWSKILFVSIEQYRFQSLFMMYASVNSTQNFQKND